MPEPLEQQLALALRLLGTAELEQLFEFAVALRLLVLHIPKVVVVPNLPIEVAEGKIEVWVRRNLMAEESEPKLVLEVSLFEACQSAEVRCDFQLRARGSRQGLHIQISA